MINLVIISQISRINSSKIWMILTIMTIIILWIRMRMGRVLWIYLELQRLRRRMTQIVVSCQGRLKLVAQSDDLILILQKYMYFILQMYDWFFKKHSTKNRLFICIDMFLIIFASYLPVQSSFRKILLFY